MLNKILNSLFGAPSEPPPKIIGRPIGGLPFPKIPDEFFLLPFSSFREKITALCNASGLYTCQEETDRVILNITEWWFAKLARRQPNVFDSNGELTQMQPFVASCFEVAKANGADVVKFHDIAAEEFRVVWWDKIEKEQHAAVMECFDDSVEDYLRDKRPEVFR